MRLKVKGEGAMCGMDLRGRKRKKGERVFPFFASFKFLLRMPLNPLD